MILARARAGGRAGWLVDGLWLASWLGGCLWVSVGPAGLLRVLLQRKLSGKTADSKGPYVKLNFSSLPFLQEACCLLKVSPNCTAWAMYAIPSR